MIAYFINRGRPVMSPRRHVRTGCGVAELSIIAFGSHGMEVTDGPGPALALAAVAELPHSMAHPNR